MFSIARRGVTLSVLVVAVMAMVVGSSQADGVIVPPPVWDCVITQPNLDDGYHDVTPDVTEKFMVWLRGQNGDDLEVFVQYRLTGEILQITDNSLNESNVKVDGKYITWLSPDPSDTTYDIGYYSLVTGQTQIIQANMSNNYGFKFDGNYVVWKQTVNDTDSIGIYNIATGVQSELGDNTGAMDFIPFAISGERLLYLRKTDSSWWVQIYNLAGNTKTLTVSNALSATTAKMHLAMHGDIVVWANKQGRSGKTWEIFAYNLATGTLTQVTNDNHKDTDPKVFGDYIVFLKETASENQLHWYQLSTGMTGLIASSPNLFEPPKIDGTFVRWNILFNDDAVIDDQGLYIYDLNVGITRKLSGFGAYSSIHNNQVFGSNNTLNIIRADCGFISPEIELPEAGLIPLP
jgi:hypothetical protein